MWLFTKRNCKKNKFIDITGEQFGYLTVLSFYENKQNKNYWNCLCKCGNTIIVSTADLKSGNTKSCGCLRSSYNEALIEEILKTNDIDYIREYSFLDLIGDNRQLRFDFAIFKNGKLKYLIEYNGIQHYKSIEYFGGNEKFLKQLEYDKKKQDYCKNNQIPLITIPFQKKPILPEQVIRKELLNENS